MERIDLVEMEMYHRKLPLEKELSKWFNEEKTKYDKGQDELYAQQGTE